MDLLLSNKVAIVTGASRGIGKAIAETLSVEGMKVALVARSPAELESLAKSLPNESHVQIVDLREPDSANQVVASTIEKFGSLDLLVNNAGATKRGDFLAPHRRRMDRWLCLEILCSHAPVARRVASSASQ